MNKLLLILVSGVIMLSGCNKSDSTQSDQFVGTWQNLGMDNLKLVISKHDGGDGYTINEEIYHKLVPATLDTPEHPAKTDKHSYSGMPDGNTLSVNAGFGEVVPLEIKDNQLYFDTGRKCANCNVYKKIN